MARHHEIYRFVSDDVQPSEHPVQRYRSEYCCYFELLVQMTLKKDVNLKLTDFNHVTIDGTIKKSIQFQQQYHHKKETHILLDYFSGLQVSPGKLDKLHKPAQKILENKDMYVEDKIELLYDIETQFTFTGKIKYQ